MPFKRLLVIVLSLSFLAADAQIHDSLNYKDKSEFCIGAGILSQDQWRGISHKEAYYYADLVDMPYTYTGAAFLTYRYYVMDRMSIGCTVGLDNQRGGLSYGGPHSSYGYIGGYSGGYNREAYTVAVEALYYYERAKDFSAYFFVGAGVTAAHVNYYIDPDAKANFYKIYTPVSSNITHFNAQVTPIGFKAGGRLSFFAEIGYGYKGLISAGISFRP